MTPSSDIAQLNPAATVIEARSTLTLEGGDVAGRSVVVVEDGPTLTHGEMTFGAGIVAARRFGATLVDPRPYAAGSLQAVLARYPALEPLLPAMGYGQAQMADLVASLNATPADAVLAATPIDLGRLLHLNKPVVRVRYELDEVAPPTIADVLAPIVAAVRGADLAGS